MFFIFGTGQCGMLSVANTLLEQSRCVCLHEPEPMLIEEASAFRYGNASAEQIEKMLRLTRSATQNDKPYGESSRALSWVIPAVSRAFPEAHYLWLVRNAIDFVNSASLKGWYGNHERADGCMSAVEQRWIQGQVRGDFCGDVDAQAWANMTAFEKRCWYWGYINQLIESDLRTHARNAQFRLVRLEDLGRDIGALMDWLGLKHGPQVIFDLEEPAAGQADIAVSWGEPEWAAFERWCSPLMDRLYPEWRAQSGQRTTAYDDTTELTQLNAVGEQLYNAGDLVAALRSFQQALQLAPTDPQTLDNLGVCLWALGKGGDALQCFARGMEHAPDNRNLVLNAGQVLLSSDRHADAETLYTSYLADFPDDQEIRERLSDLRDTFTPARPAPSVGADSSSADALNAEGELLFQRGDIDGATNAFQQVLNIESGHAEALNNLGTVAWTRGDPAAALGYLQRSMEVNAEHPATLRNVIAVLETMDGQADTVATVRQALDRVERLQQSA